MNKNFFSSKLGTRVVWVVLLLAAWEATAASGVFPAALFPSLAVIARALAGAVASGEIVEQTAYSLVLILQGLLMGFAGAVIISSFAMANKIVSGFVETLTAIAHPLPGIALLPLIIIWFGTGTLAIVAIIIHSALWPMLLNMTAGFRSIPPIYREAGLNLGFNPYRITRDIMIPAALPYFLSGMRISWARAWRALISAEMIFGAVGAKGGLGWYIFKQRVFMDTPGMFAGLAVIVLIGIVVEDLGFAVLEDRTVKKWGMV